MKILIIGHAQHGKDEIADALTERFNLKRMNLSLFAVRLFILQAYNGKYLTCEECYEDRHGNRAFWKECFNEYCKEDKGRFVKQALQVSDTYAGIRARDQFEATRHLFDKVIWVHRPKFPLEPELELTWHDSDLVVINAGTKEDLKREVWELKL